MVAARYKAGEIARRHRVSGAHVSVTTFIAIIKSTAAKNIEAADARENTIYKIYAIRVCACRRRK